MTTNEQFSTTVCIRMGSIITTIFSRTTINEFDGKMILNNGAVQVLRIATTSMLGLVNIYESVLRS